MHEFITPIIQVEELNKIMMDDQDLIILDASIPKVGSQDKNPLEGIQIKGARVFNLKDFSDPNSTLPNTFPSAEHFENKVRELGINQESKIVVYDNLGIYSSPRAWWMFKTMGHKQVSVLNGGLKQWMGKNYDTEPTISTSYPKGNFKSQLNTNLVKTINHVFSNISLKESLILDARATDRFNGTFPEPRQGFRSGHIPGSFNLPYADLLEDGTLKPAQQLSTLFKPYEKENSIIFSCGSGVTACILLLASEVANLRFEKYIYDGSWTEWGLSELPIEPNN